MSKEKLCPRCLNGYTEYPALSRRDNKTDICSSCGNKEAMLDYIALDKIPQNLLKEEKMFCERIGADYNDWTKWKAEMMAQSG